MKKLIWLGVVLFGLAAINAAIGATRECGCRPECWCKKPGLRHFRWILPFNLHAVPLEWKREM